MMLAYSRRQWWISVTLMGVFVKAVITDMDRPLGQAIGNALEIAEVIQTFEGAWPSRFNTRMPCDGDPFISDE